MHLFWRKKNRRKLLKKEKVLKRFSGYLRPVRKTESKKMEESHDAAIMNLWLFFSFKSMKCQKKNCFQGLGFVVLLRSSIWVIVLVATSLFAFPQRDSLLPTVSQGYAALLHPGLCRCVESREWGRGVGVVCEDCEDFSLFISPKTLA